MPRHKHPILADTLRCFLHLRIILHSERVVFEGVKLCQRSIDNLLCGAFLPRRTVSRLITFTRETSRPESSMFPGIKSIPSSWWRIPSPGSTSSSLIKFPIMVASVTSKLSGSAYPRLAVRLPCASASINSTFFPYFASPIPKLLVVVVLPTPPF